MKFKKIIILTMIDVFLIYNLSYAKYIYQFDESVVKLQRDTSEPICEVTYSSEEWTNENVVITITSNKKIQPVSGFELSKNKKVLTKEVSENENGKITIYDLSGNFEEVEYSVTNIDKILPEIRIIKNDSSNFVSVECEDNVEIKDVYVDKYDDKLEIQSYQNYWDASYYYGIDRTDTSITVHVEKHPENTRKYEYYLNNKLYTVAKDQEMIFTGLKCGKKYKVKVKALDKNGLVLEESELALKTSYFSNIKSSKNKNKFEAQLSGLNNKVKNIKYAVWNYNCLEQVNWFSCEILDNSANIQLKNKNDQYYPFYGMHVYLYDENEKVLDVIEFSVDFETNYKKDVQEIDLNNLDETNKYQIILKDYAQNEKIFHIIGNKIK